MNDFLKKLTSRKFMLAAVGMVSGISLAFGVDGGEIADVIQSVAGIVTAMSSAIAYINAEAKVDAARAGDDK